MTYILVSVCESGDATTYLSCCICGRYSQGAKVWILVDDVALVAQWQQRKEDDRLRC